MLNRHWRSIAAAVLLCTLAAAGLELLAYVAAGNDALHANRTAVMAPAVPHTQARARPSASDWLPQPALLHANGFAPAVARAAHARRAVAPRMTSRDRLATLTVLRI